MSVYKYFTQEGALRYLSSWAMRITPPNQFNDPFEMRPRFTAITPSEVRKMSASVLQEELVKALTKKMLAARGIANVPLMESFTRYLLSCETAADQTLLAQHFPVETLPSARAWFDQQLPLALAAVDSQLPEWNSVVETALHASIPGVLGVLCVSGSSRNPLMWSHYADSHRGVMLEFDDTDPAFNRRRGANDDFGYLRRVSYSDSRPQIGTLRGEDTFIQLALIKAIDWAYEQEQRLIWPLEYADRHVTNGADTIHLLDIPARSVRSITVGCKAQDSYVQQLTTTLLQASNVAHIRVLRASVCKDTFALNYEAI